MSGRLAAHLAGLSCTHYCESLAAANVSVMLAVTWAGIGAQTTLDTGPNDAAVSI